MSLDARPDAGDRGCAPERPVGGPAEPTTVLRSVVAERETGFVAACAKALKDLSERYPFGLWMVTRAVDDDWIVLAADDRHYGVGPGTLFRWTDSFCSRMVRGEGPNLALDAGLVPVYRGAPIAQQVEIGAYVGLPMYGESGQLFGTLCAIDPYPWSAEPVPDVAQLQLVADLLGRMLEVELDLQKARRQMQQAVAESQTDALTGLVNRRAWETAVAYEEARCLRYGSPAAVFYIDLDSLKEVNDTLGHGAGDQVILRAAEAIRSAAREADVVARLGGDEFAVLAVECDVSAARRIRSRIEEALQVADVAASVGSALRRGGRQGALADAEREAEAEMYENKRRRTVGTARSEIDIR